MKTYLPDEQPTPLRELARDVLGSALFAGLLTGALHLLGRLADAASTRRNSDVDAPETANDVEAERDDYAAEEAARMLGVSVDAGEAEIRGALRAVLIREGLHPDHGGDTDRTAELLDARNLLIERARARKVTEASP